MVADPMRKRGLWLVCALLYSALAASIGLSTLDDKSLVFPFTMPTGNREVIGELAASSRVCQSFVARYDGLSRVEVAMFDYGRRNVGPFEFSLRPSPDAPDIVILVHDASTVKDGTYHIFGFAPIVNSAGRRFYFCLQAPHAELQKAVSAWGFTEDVYPRGEAVFRGMWGQKAGVRDLDFRLGYKPGTGERLSILFQRLVSHAPGKWFYVALILAWWAALCIWLYVFVQR